MLINQIIISTRILDKESKLYGESGCKKQSVMKFDKTADHGCVQVYACGLIFWEILTWNEYGYPYQGNRHTAKSIVSLLI